MWYTLLPQPHTAQLQGSVVLPVPSLAVALSNPSRPGAEAGVSPGSLVTRQSAKGRLFILAS